MEFYALKLKFIASPKTTNRIFKPQINWLMSTGFGFVVEFYH